MVATSASPGRALLAAALWLALCGAFTTTRGAEIRLLSANVFTGVLDAPVADYARRRGDSVTIVYATAGAVRKRLEQGEPADVTILPRPMLEALLSAGKIAPGITDLARSGVGVAVRRGGVRPDIGSVEAVKRMLAAAPSISYADPARGGATGVLVTRDFERLGVTDAMKAKTRFPPGDGFAVDVVAKGEAEIALAQPMEIVGQPALELVGMLPAELQDPPAFTFSTAALATPKDMAAAQALIRFLAGPELAAALKARGMATVAP